MSFNVETLSRLQFALTIMFHYLFPPLSIGLGMLMVIMEGLYLKTGNRQYEAMARFWTRIFAVNFAMGVATGIVMEFQFGTNWSTYARFVGDVFGSALAAEGIFAFFLESGFLSVLVFGWDRVGKGMHFFSTCMVCLGAIFSSVWIIIANSWQQTPAGSHVETFTANGVEFKRAVIDNFWQVVFNPSAMPRLAHALAAAFVLGAFVVMSISAFYILKNRFVEMAKKMFTIALIFGAGCSVLTGLLGHEQAIVVAEHQPGKLAAFEGYFHQEEGGAPLLLAGYPDEKEWKVQHGVFFPGGLSFLVHFNFHDPVLALDDIPPDERPHVLIPFLAFHVMVGVGTALIGLSMLALFFRWRGTLFEKRWLLWSFVFAVVGPYIANQAGWVAAESGRQPWVVWKLLRTRDAYSHNLTSGQVVSSIIMFGLIYALLFAVWVYVLNDKIQHGPEEPDEAEAQAGKEVGKGIRGILHEDPMRMTMILRKSDTDKREKKGGAWRMMDLFEIHTFWFAALGFLLTGYAILDGFDLGVGILHLCVREDMERRILMNSIGPIWDGNAVWLVTFGGALFAAFPYAYAASFSGFYLPFMLLLFALIFRAVSMEFRSKKEWPAWRSFWDFAFFGSSTLATFLFGVAVGNSMLGMPIDANREFYLTPEVQQEFLGSVKGLLGWYPILVGGFAVSLFAMHGSIYLYLKTEGALQQRIKGWMWRTYFVFVAFYIATSVATISKVPECTKNFDNFWLAKVVVVLNVLAVLNISRAIHFGKTWDAFVSSACTIAALTFLFGIAIFPNLVVSSINPDFNLTVQNAASSENTLKLMRMIAFMGLPFMMSYTIVIYWIFRGKVQVGKLSY